MRVMDKKRNGWQRVFGLADDLDEWMQLLEKEGRIDSRSIWSGLNTEAVVNLVEELLEEFKECLKASEGKIDAVEKVRFKRISTEARGILNSFRKEHQL